MSKVSELQAQIDELQAKHQRKEQELKAEKARMEARQRRDKRVLEEEAKLKPVADMWIDFLAGKGYTPSTKTTASPDGTNIVVSIEESSEVWIEVTLHAVKPKGSYSWSDPKRTGKIQSRIASYDYNECRNYAPKNWTLKAKAFERFLEVLDTKTVQAKREIRQRAAKKAAETKFIQLADEYMEKPLSESQRKYLRDRHETDGNDGATVHLQRKGRMLKVSLSISADIYDEEKLAALEALLAKLTS